MGLPYYQIVCYENKFSILALFLLKSMNERFADISLFVDNEFGVKAISDDLEHNFGKSGFIHDGESNLDIVWKRPNVSHCLHFFFD